MEPRFRWFDQAREDPFAGGEAAALFIGDVGRPDLFPGIALELAGKLYGSLHEKLLAALSARAP